MDTNTNGIAIIGMTGRFPGARNVDEFWRNLIAGVESTSVFSDEELATPGVDVAALKKTPGFMAARGIVKDPDMFDAGFFNITAKEAEVIDPQQRLFLEASWEALENAGYDPSRFKGYIGVFAGMGSNTYYLNNLHSRPDVLGLVGKLAITLGNEKDYISTRVAYKLNLRGPAVSTNTACSTSLVAVCQASQALLGYQCDIALAGGISVTFPQKRASYYQEGGMLSPDGHCRPFDAQAAGTYFSDGLGAVVLKRLDEALNDGDQIYAVVKGVGVNNDGSDKVGFAAPSVRGQAEAIALALAHADVEPDTISYVEAHGTATPLGDPIEIAALTRAFRSGTARKNFCAIGSVKGNIGHLDAAAGVAGLIKTALALKHKKLPPSLNFTQPNPKIDFANSPFFVNSKLVEWKAGDTPRRAGVSSFGIGGTNAHVVLEEAPALELSSSSREWQLLLLSAKTASALDAATDNFVAHLKANPNLNLANAAYTLQVGRRIFDHRRMLVCRNIDDAIQALGSRDPKRVITQHEDVKDSAGAGIFPDQFSSSKDQEVFTMLAALGQQWLAGKPVDWSGFYSGEKRQRVSLPGYPFERQRFWVEPAHVANPQPDRALIIDTSTVATSSEDGSESLSATTSRKDRLTSMLKVQFRELSGANTKDIDPSVSFMEMGFDSLYLAQASQSLEKKFGVRIAFRQMLENLSTINDLANYLDENLPLEAFATSQITPTSSPVNSSATSAAAAPNLTIEAIQAEIQALTHQLNMLRRAESPQPAAVKSLALSRGIQTDDADTALEPPAKPAEPPGRTGTDEDDSGQAGIISLPLTGQQMELWLTSQAGEDASRTFNQVFAVRLRGRLNEVALRGILQRLVNRHDALRTTFAPDGSAQRISPSWKIDLPSRDLSALSNSEQEREVTEAMAQEDQTIFDLVKGPLFHSRLLKLSQDSCVLILAAHHIILDGWSMGVLLREFGYLYDSWERGVTAGVEPAMQYREYIQWQDTAKHRAKVEADEAYWLARYSTLPNDLELPADHPRPPVKTYRAASKSFVLDPAFYDSMKQTAAAHDCTLFVFLLAALKAWMFRLTGEEDLVVGIPAAGQLAVEDHPGSWSLVGHCVNALPLRSQCDGKAAFSDYLKSIRNLLLDAYEHQNITLGTLVRKLRLRTDPSRAPLVPLMFNLGRMGRQLRQPGSHVIMPPKAFNFFDLNIEAQDTGKEIEVVCRYNTALFDEARAERMMRHFQILLESMVADPACAIDELRMMGEAEQRQILVDWNKTDAPCSMTPAHELVAAQCARTPGATAIEFEGTAVTYRELLERSQRLAAHLQSLGAQPGQLIGICSGRSPDMIVGLLGILMSGGAYVPLDPEFPAVRLQNMIEDAAPPIIVTQRAVEAALPKNDARLVYLEDERPSAGDFQAPESSPENIAYVLFTSGSTGRPKGVEIPHRALTNLLESMRECPGLAASDILLAVTTLSFDIAGLEIFLPLICGAKILLAGREESHDPRLLVEMLKKSAVTVMQATPATWRGMLAAGWDGSSKLKILCGGEAMTRDLAEALLSRSSSLWNVYGPTETTIWSTVEKVGPGTGTVAIGHPIANTLIYILDAHGQPQPVGIPGELCIGGLGVARGYLKRDDLTAQKFISDPHGKPGERIYKTGDLARWRLDGTIEYFGRIDHQVKVRGFRIELAEIESALGAHPAVKQCVVVAREDHPGEDKRLVAYVVSGGGVGDPELRVLLKSKLPDYMVPSAFVFLDALPLTPNGKVDRKALPAPGQIHLPKRVFAKPRTPLEQKLVATWSRILKIEKVGIHDNFFELGGHSLIAVSLFTEIERKLGKRLPLATLFQAPTIAQLAAVIQQESAPAPWSPLVAIQPNGKREPFFCIHGADGEVLFCYKLASLLGEDQPFYGLQAQGTDGGPVRHSSMEEIATYYIKEIRTVQPQGPYFLGGFSLGGVLALEMAQQLLAQGEKVALIALLDTNNPTVPPRRYTLRERIVLRRRVIAGMSLRDKVGFILYRGFMKVVVRTRVKIYKLTRVAYNLFSKDKERVASRYRTVRVHETNSKALDNYRPYIYPGKLTLIRVENPNDGFEFDAELGWTGLAAGGFEILDVPGEHETVFKEPHVRSLAATMRDCIEKARNANGLQ